MASHTHPGWLIMMPGGHPHSWCARTSTCPDPAAALCWLQPDPARRAALIAAGWSVRAGAGGELHRPVMAGVRSA